MSDNKVTITVNINGERITRTELYLQMAKLNSLRGTCKRGQNGAIITQNNRVVSTGYNGSIIKKWVCSEQCDTTHKCTHAVHAEANAIAAAAKEGIKLDGSTIYCTSSPCYDCAKLIIQAGIKVIVYSDEYTTDGGKGLALLNGTEGIEVYQHTV
jgi:dCMP deaminase